MKPIRVLLSDSITREILRAVEAGQCERDLALDIDWRLRKAGFERTAFETREDQVALGSDDIPHHAEHFDLEVFELAAGKDSAADPDHARPDLVQRQIGRLGNRSGDQDRECQGGHRKCS